MTVLGLVETATVINFEREYGWRFLIGHVVYIDLVTVLLGLGLEP